MQCHSLLLLFIQGFRNLEDLQKILIIVCVSSDIVLQIQYHSNPVTEGSDSLNKDQKYLYLRMIKKIIY